jgi:hypothetical protein
MNKYRNSLIVGFIMLCLVIVAPFAFSILNSSSNTCSWVGCVEWCNSSGSNCGLPIPPGGWKYGQTQWSG